MCEFCETAGKPWDDPEAKPSHDLMRVIKHRGLPGNPHDPYARRERFIHDEPVRDANDDLE